MKSVLILFINFTHVCGALLSVLILQQFNLIYLYDKDTIENFHLEGWFRILIWQSREIQIVCVCIYIGHHQIEELTK